MKLKQTGSTLIVVLIMLVALTVIGTLAIRQSIVSLNIATNGQAQQLLIQNSDAALFNVEDTNNLVRSLARDGMFGFIKGPTNRGKELVFCYRGSRAQFFTLSQSSIIENRNGTIVNNSIGANGYCDVTQNTHFTSARRAVITQVAVTFVESGNVNPFQFAIRGTDPEKAKIEETERVVVRATSLVPVLSNATDAQINNCLRTRLNHVDVTSTQSVVRCLQDLGVPITTHVTEYTLGQAFI